MARKRQPITFPELEPKGRGAILRSREEIDAEAAVSSQHSGIPGVQNAGIPETQKAGVFTVSSRSGAVVSDEINRAEYTKVTYRISPEALEAIDEAKRLLRRQYGVRVSFEEIAEEAILRAFDDLVQNQSASFLANKFSGNPETQKGG